METSSAVAPETTFDDQELVESLLSRISSDLAMIIDREFHIQSVVTERANKRPEGKGCIHLSFKLGFRVDGDLRHGCVLVPLPDAISLANYLMMEPDETVENNRQENALDASTKDAMLEVGNFVAGAGDAVLRSWLTGCSVRAEGCQGVRPDVRPALIYDEGSELIVGRATAQIHDYPEFEMLVVLPSLKD